MSTDLDMTTLSSAHFRQISLFSYLTIGGFLVAHGINAFVAQALYLPPDQGFAPAATESAAAAVSSAAQQFAEDVRTSGLFALPAAPLAGGGVSPGMTVGAATRASIGAAAKIRLIGVVLGSDRGVFAIVEELASKKQALYRLHEQIPDIGEVSDIRRDGMVVRLGSLEELLELAAVEKPVMSAVGTGATPAPAAGAPLHRVVDRREVEQAMSDLPKLMTQARAVPNMVNGSLNGFRIDYIAPASFYERIGIQSGDVLQRVNGVDIRDPSTMLSLFQQLKNERTVKLDMVRNNQRSTMTYELR
jgi:general secretion pathway protein C